MFPLTADAPGLISRVARITLVLSVLPMVLLPAAQTDLVLLHSDCAGQTHAHRVDPGDLRTWQFQHAQADQCCASETDEHPGTDPDAACGHNRPPIVITQGPLLATRAGHDLNSAKAPVSPGPALTEAAIRPAPELRATDAAGRPGPSSDGAARVLSRNHALLL